MTNPLDKQSLTNKEVGESIKNIKQDNREIKISYKKYLIEKYGFSSKYNSIPYPDFSKSIKIFNDAEARNKEVKRLLDIFNCLRHSLSTKKSDIIKNKDKGMEYYWNYITYLDWKSQ